MVFIKDVGRVSIDTISANAWLDHVRTAIQRLANKAQRPIPSSPKGRRGTLYSRLRVSLINLI